MPIGIPAAMLISSAVATGGSVAASALANRGKKTTTQPIYTPEQTRLQSSLTRRIEERLANPEGTRARLAPMKVSAIGSLNKAYKGATQRLEERLASRGYARSGKLPATMRQFEIARAGDIGGIEGRFAGFELDEEARLIDQAQRLAYSGPGTMTTGSGNAAGAGLSSGVETLTTLFMLNQMMNGGGADDLFSLGGTDGPAYAPMFDLPALPPASVARPPVAGVMPY
jgi:hypothetical protein